MKELLLKLEIPFYLVLFSAISFENGSIILGIILLALALFRYKVDNLK